MSRWKDLAGQYWFSIYSHHAVRRRAFIGKHLHLHAICSSLVWSCFLSCPLMAQPYTIVQKIAVPAYFVPGAEPRLAPFWPLLNQSAPSVGIAVPNVVNGPDY